MKLDSRVTLINLVNHLAKCAPKMLKKEEPEFSFNLLSSWLGKELAFELLSALNAIRLELVPMHVKDMKLVNAFWSELVCEAATNAHLYIREAPTSSDLIDEFGDRWKKPLSKFEVIYSLDYLKVGAKHITFHGVEFFTPTDTAIAERAIPKSAIDRWSKYVDFLTLAIVRVDASSSSTAFETGRERVVDALSLMKASALWGLAGKILPDEFVQWKLSGHYIVNAITAAHSTHRVWGIQHQFRPIVIELSDYIQKGVEGLGINHFSNIPKDISERVTRALHWISHSATHEGDDYKLVDLCTALEILLLPEGRQARNKGGAIALRYNLLGGTLNPCVVKWLYDRRNDVVHGNKLPIVTQMDIWHLRLVCYTTVDLTVHASAKWPEITTLQELMATMETEDTLTKFLKLADMGMYEGPLLLPVVEQATKKLKKLRLADR